MYTDAAELAHVQMLRYLLTYIINNDVIIVLVIIFELIPSHWFMTLHSHRDYSSV